MLYMFIINLILKPPVKKYYKTTDSINICIYIEHRLHKRTFLLNNYAYKAHANKNV